MSDEYVPAGADSSIRTTRDSGPQPMKIYAPLRLPGNVIMAARFVLPTGVTWPNIGNSMSLDIDVPNVGNRGDQFTYSDTTKINLMGRSTGSYTFTNNRTGQSFIADSVSGVSPGDAMYNRDLTPQNNEAAGIREPVQQPRDPERMPPAPERRDTSRLDQTVSSGYTPPQAPPPGNRVTETSGSEPGDTSRSSSSSTRVTTTSTRGAPGSPNNRGGSQYRTGSARTRDPIQDQLWRQRTDALHSLYSELGDSPPSYRGQYINHSTHRTRDGREYAYDRQQNKWIEVTNPYAVRGNNRYIEEGEGRNRTRRRMTSEEMMQRMRENWRAGQTETPEGWDEEAAWNEWNNRRIQNEEAIRRAQQDDQLLYSRGRGFFGTEPARRPRQGNLRNTIGAPRVTSDEKTKNIIEAIDRKY